MGHNTKVRLIAVLVMVLGLFASGVLTTAIASSQGQHELVYTDRAEDGDPPQVALGIAMGAFRGIFVNILWLEATAAKEEGRFYESIELASMITKLQPRLPQVWTFHAWNMAYNISVTTHTPEERWQWVKAGIDLLRKEGLRANPNDMHMHKELGWLFLHKVAGYTDDANQYYKRQFAYEWQNIMGPAPTINPDERGRYQVIELYAQWVQKIVDAPDSRTLLAEANPTADAIARAYESGFGINSRLGADAASTEEFLRRYQLDMQIIRAGKEWTIEEVSGPKTKLMHALRQQYANEQDWTDLANYLRKKLLVNEYNMEPVRMVQQVRKYGPIDWRLPSAHALYWSSRGTDVGRMEVNARTRTGMDFLNAYRIVMQSIQDLWRHGDLYFNYLDVHEGRAAYYQAVPNVYFVPTYGAMLNEVVNASGIYEADHKPYRQYSVGYENFLRDAVRFFYRRGDNKNAEFWFDKLRNFEGVNVNDPDFAYEMSLSLKDFADKQLYDSLGAPQVAVSEVFASLQSAYFNGLMVRDMDVFKGQWDYARKAHAYYFKQQFNEVVASSNTARMEFMDRDFSFLAGQLFASMIMTVHPEQAELLYAYAPDDLKRYAYDSLAIQFKPMVDEMAAAGKSEPFATLFPEPVGMEQFRRTYEAKIDARSKRGVEGIQQN
tara:strand:- start:40236 stop:42224 length:1989 start_codon:yes stop_codon:yes gene_type:complete